MNYYEDSFRYKLSDILQSYRKLLVQLETKEESPNRIFMTDTIKQLDDVCKIIKPSIFDFLTENKIKKMQESKYYQKIITDTENQLHKKIFDELEKTMKEKIKSEMRIELEQEIREELLKEKQKKKAKKKAKQNSDTVKQMDEFLQKLNAIVEANSKPTDYTSKQEEPVQESIQQEEDDNYYTNFDDEEIIG